MPWLRPKQLQINPLSVLHFLRNQPWTPQSVTSCRRLFFFLSLFFFCPPECFNSLCNFLLLPTLKSERRRLGKGKKSDLQHMIAEHYTEVSLRNSQNISAYQLQGDVTGFIFGCEPDNTFDSPSLRGSESEEGRLDVWGGKRQRRCVQWGEKRVGVGGGGVFLPARATYCMTGSDYGCAACAAVPARTDAAPRREALRLYASFHYRSSPRRCRPRSTSVLPQSPPPHPPTLFFLPPPHPFCLLHLPNPPPPPPPSFISLYPSSHHFCLLSPFPLAPLASLPPALLFSTFEASLVSASSDKLWI